MAARRIILLLLLPWLGLLPWPVDGLAVEPPVCTAAALGSVACIAERLCRCAYERGGSTTETPAGYRWDCGVRRPFCHRPPERASRHDALDDLRLFVPVAPPRTEARRDRPRPAPLPAPP